MQIPLGYQFKETLFTSKLTKVFRATRERDGKSVIIRAIVDAQSFEDSNTTSRYSRLAFTHKVLTHLDHPNIVKILDWIDETQQAYLVMEDIYGINLWLYAERFESNQVPLKDFLKLAIQLADALSVIHHHQVIHKDLHPGNIVINPDTGLVQIIDFGLASLLSREHPSLATPDRLEGILAYISPEQTGRMNRALDYRCDFYTLGITFFQLLTGKLPFETVDALGMVYAHMAILQQPVKALRPEIPTSLSRLIDKLMDKNAEGRYQSALGLKHDLRHCLDDLEKNSESIFNLGVRDISSYFNIPQVLYGRKQEVQTLMQHFHLASAGQPQLLAVAGYSGIGKSALVNEVHKPIAALSGLFIQGKFDQFQKNVPFSAFKRALAGWVQTTLSFKESTLSVLREQLKQTLGANARVLIDFMADFQYVLGDLPAIPELGAQESQNRFYLVMQRFIKLISQLRPLVIFIDDLQWADRGTLNLLPELLGESGCRLLVIVAYRDNEVDATHAVTQTLNTLKKHSVQNEQRNKDTRDSANEAATSIVSELNLGPLPLAQVQQLLSDALHRSENEVRLLAELVIQKTGGNPFFSIEFLKKLYSENLLNFDLQRQQWHWNLNAIKAKGITDNVVELMLSKIQSLPSETQHILQLAACVGTYFDIENLAILAETDMSEVAHTLWPALQEGLLIQEGGDWFLGMHGKRPKFNTAITSLLNTNTQNERRKSPWVPRCKFLHDRMLQAAYESLNEKERQQTHLNIGRLLLAHTESAELENKLFDIIEQLNQGRGLITSLQENLQLAQLNLIAAKHAKQSSVWDTALSYVRIGISLLPEQAWQSHPELAYKLHLIQVECEFLVSNYEYGKTLAESLLEQAKTPLEKAQICFLLASQQVTLTLDYCITLGMEGLVHCGLKVPKINQVDAVLVKQEFQALQGLLKQKNWQQKTKLNNNKTIPLEISMAYRLYAQLAITAQVAGKPQLYFYIIYKGLRTALENGLNEQAIILYATYSMGSAKQARYIEANHAAKTALTLLDSYPKCADIPYIYMTLGTFVWFYQQPMQESIELQMKAHALGYEYGDISRGVVAGYSNSIINKYSQGLALNHLRLQLKTFDGLIKKYDVKVSGGRYYSRLVTMLMQPELGNQLVASSFTKEEWQLIQSCVLKAFIDHLQVQAYFWSDQASEAWQAVQATEASLPMMSGFIIALEQRYIAALLACRKTNINNKNSHTLIQRSLNELQGFVEFCPENFEHKLVLLLAEIGFSEDQSIEQLKPLYEQAIRSAKHNGFLQYQALANELYGRVWLAKGIKPMAEIYLTEALELYQLWGCKVKVINLQTRYQSLFIFKVSNQTESQTESTYLRLSTSEKSTQIDSLAGLDLSSVMKFSQLISGELALDKLLNKVMQVIVESSGAQSAAFILKSEQGANIAADLHHDQGQTIEHINLSTRPLNNAKNLPISLIDYVLRSENEVLLQEGINTYTESNKTVQTVYADDPYLQRYQPQSMLCTPIKYRDQTLGALYLENKLSSHAFPKARLDIINMLLSQAAISLENARMFTEISELNTGLESKVLSKTKKLSDALNAQEALNESILKKTNKLDAANKKLTLLTITDSLTGAFSRRHFLELADKEIARAHRYQHNTVVLMLDIDWFKKVNDKYGHAAGDEALRKVSAACLESLRQQDVFGRLGGEEFAILLPETDITAGQEIAERIRENVANLNINTASAEFRVTLSIGLSELSLKDQTIKKDVKDQAQCIKALLQKADSAMYQSKEKGRNQLTLA